MPLRIAKGVMGERSRERGVGPNENGAVPEHPSPLNHIRHASEKSTPESYKGLEAIQIVNND